MPDENELEESIKKEIDDYGELLDGAKKVNELVPHLQDKKEQAEAKLKFVQRMPGDVRAEIAPLIAPLQKADEEKRKSVLPGLVGIDVKMTRQLLSSSSTSSIAEVTVSIVKASGKHPRWLAEASQPLDALADSQARENAMNQKLRDLNPELGDTFLKAQQSYRKAKAGTEGVDQAANRMRSVIQGFWGELVDVARKHCPDIIGKGRRELNTPSHRRNTAECLFTDDSARVLYLLDSMDSIYQELSSEFAKRPLSEHTERFESLHTRWFLNLHDLAELISAFVN